jgi:acyl carrier protein
VGLDLVELHMAIEEDFGITVPNEQFCDCRTVGDISRLVHELVPALETREVVQRVARLVAVQSGRKPATISGGDRLIEDLGLD